MAFKEILICLLFIGLPNGLGAQNLGCISTPVAIPGGGLVPVPPVSGNDLCAAACPGATCTDTLLPTLPGGIIPRAIERANNNLTRQTPPVALPANGGYLVILETFTCSCKRDNGCLDNSGCVDWPNGAPGTWPQCFPDPWATCTNTCQNTPQGTPFFCLYRQMVPAGSPQQVSLGYCACCSSP